MLTISVFRIGRFLLSYRPLPEEMLEYARSDTHFLLYIYDNLRNALIDRAQSRSQSRAQSPQSQLDAPTNQDGDPSHALIKLVLSHSEDTALRTYEKDVYDAEGGGGSGGWDTLARKWNKGSLLEVGIQKNVFKCVHAWRDRAAREDDESTRHVHDFILSITLLF